MSSNTESIEATKLLFLNDTYLFESNALLQKISTDQKGYFINFSQTVFYPQSGGQPSDIGTIEIEPGLIVDINFVGFNDTLVNHYFNADNEALKSLIDRVDLIGKEVQMKVNSDRRIVNAKCHTSGHLIASVVEKIAPELVGVKGYHFQDGAYVEFQGKLTSKTANELTEAAVSLMKAKIEENANLIVKELSAEEVQANESLVKYLKNLKANQNLRTVQIEGFEMVPCGGTHLKNLAELKNVFVKKISASKGNTRVSYGFE